MSFREQICSAEASEKRPYMETGAYVYQVQRCIEFTTRKGVGCFVAELLIKESTNPNRPVGMGVSFVQLATNDASPGNIKAFLVGATGMEYDDLTTEDLDDILGEKQDLAGTLVRCVSEQRKTKNDKTYLSNTWTTYQEPATEKPAAKKK